MLPNMKFYIVSIVAIFVALGIGIYVGFSMDTEGFITDQQENLVKLLETQFDKLIEDNINLEESKNVYEKENQVINKYIDESYNFIVPARLDGVRVAIIETNTYVSSSIGYDLEKAGAKIMNLTSIKDLKEEEVKELTEIIAKGGGREQIQAWTMEDKISSYGNFDEGVDLFIVCGGSDSDKDNHMDIYDKNIIRTAKSLEKNVVGTEKSYVGYSYISKYKEQGVTTVDNIDSKMGKISLVLAINSSKGNYGTKSTANSILPSY